MLTEIFIGAKIDVGKILQRLKMLTKNFTRTKKCNFFVGIKSKILNFYRDHNTN